MFSVTYCGPSGSPESLIAIVGEQPGRDEAIRTHRPFTGPAGQNSDECLHAAGIIRSEVYLTNVIKDFDAPLEDYIKIISGKYSKALVSQKGQAYIDLLKEELSSTAANIIVAYGNVALYALTSRVGITNWRGSILDSTLLPGRKVIPTFHPATWTWEKLYQNPKAYLNKYLVIHDLKRAKHESAFPEIRRKDRKLIIKPSYSEVLEYLFEVERSGMSGSVVDYDIELVPKNQELSCISITAWDNYCMCIPFVYGGGDYFSPEQELAILQRLGEILENPTIKKSGQNLIFDSHYLLRKYGLITRNMGDTMIAQGVLYPEFRKGLDFITSMWTDIPYYKREGKIWLQGGSDWENGWNYNNLDSISCADARPKQLLELSEKGNSAAYERQVKLIPPLTYMMEHGIRIDLEGMIAAHKKCEEEILELTDQTYSLMGQRLNLNSPQQLCQYFYVTKGIRPYLDPDTKAPTVGVDAMKRLASTHGLKEASLILRIRRLGKRRSTFLDPRKVDSDGRIRCSYNPVGTKFSRISSSENIFGTGLNLQNLPHECLTYFLADDGYVVYSLDYSQYENRIVAYVGNIPQMIEVFESGLDSHAMTFSLMSKELYGQTVSYSDVSRSPGSCRLGDGEHSERDWGKRANHAFNYRFGPNSFSLKYEVPQAQGTSVYKAYHRAYPRLASGYWVYVEEQLRRDRTLTNLFDRKVTFYGKWSESLLAEACSCIPQGTCGDAINERGIEKCYYDSDFLPVELLTQIHDSMEIQIPLQLPIVRHAELLIKLKQSMEQPLYFQGREIHTPVDLVVNDCLNKELGEEIASNPKLGRPKFADNVEELAQHLEESWKLLKAKGSPSERLAQQALTR